MEDCIIYHNPTCSKSRATIALLQERNEGYEVVEYLKNPPSPEQLDRICRELDMEPTAIVRFKESRCAELGISKRDDRKREEWIEILCENPILIERPILTRHGKAVIARPPENILSLFS